MVTEQVVFAFGWAPWSCIVAGMVTALALSIIMALLGVALGFTVITPKSDDPMSGLGVALGIWGGLSIIVCTAGGGFTAGLLAGQRGLEIGFLTWAMTTIAAMFFSGLAIGGAVRTVGSAVRSVGSGAASVAASVGKNAAGAAAYAVSELRDNIHFDFDKDKVNENVLGVLRDTGIDSLQPEYLKDRMQETRAELKELVHHIALNPSSAQQAFNEFLEKAKSRLAALNFDKNTAVTALMNTRQIPREEAEKLVDNAVTAYNKALETTREKLADAKDRIAEAKVQLHHLGDQTREKADGLTSSAAKAALGSALALILAAAISMGAGYCGAKRTSSLVAIGGQIQNTTLAR